MSTAVTDRTPVRVMCNHRARLARAASTPSGIAPGDLDEINKYTLTPVTADEVIVRSAYLANDQVDDRFTRTLAPAIDKIATLLAGAPLMRNHDGREGHSEGLPVGRWFRGWTETDEAGAYWDVGKFYMVREPMTESLAKRMDAGIISEVSINVWTLVRDLRCSVCNRNPYTMDSGCTHQVGKTYGEKLCTIDQLDVDALDEVSLVWMGGKKGTSIELPDEDDQGAQATSLARLINDRRLHLEAHTESVAPAEVNALAAWWGDPIAGMRSWFNSAG